MADKKYYWLKLKRDFFKRHDIRIIESMPNGKDYILFYLKLLCESVDHEGNLRFSEEIPYNEDMLATVTNTNVDVVRNAIKIFTELKMMDIMDDGTFYMNEVQKMIGVATQDEHTRESTRLRVQRHREKKKQALIEGSRYSNVTCNGETDKEKDIDIEKEIDKQTYTVTDCLSDDEWNILKDTFVNVARLIDFVDDSINARGEKTKINNPFKYVLAVAEANNWERKIGG